MVLTKSKRYSIRKGSLTAPLSGDVHVNRPLTNFSQFYAQNLAGFVSMRAFPNLPVQFKSDLYWEYNRGDLLRDDAEERADATESQATEMRQTTTPYACRRYAVHKDVTDEQRSNADPGQDPMRIATRLVTHKLMLKRERLFTTTFMGTGKWSKDLAGAAAASGTEFVWWSRTASDPGNDIRQAKRYVHERTGYRPNKMVIGRQAWDTLLENDSVLARISGGATTAQPAIVMQGLIAQLFELDAIHVMDGVVNTAKRGATDSIGFISADDALLYYAPDTVGLEEPTAGTQFSWSAYAGATEFGGRIKTFRMENVEAERVEGQMYFDYKLTGSALGFYFSNITE